MFERLRIVRKVDDVEPEVITAETLAAVAPTRVPTDHLGDSLRRWMNDPAERAADAAVDGGPVAASRHGVDIGADRLSRIRRSDNGEPLLGDLTDSAPQVRVHTGDRSGVLAELGADALTDGADIHFAEGRFAPATPSGDALVQHELAHVAQTGGQPSGLVQLKLAGTSAAVLAYGGEASKKSRALGGGYSKIVKELAQYEEAEAKARPGNFKPADLLKRVGSLETRVAKWLGKHRLETDDQRFYPSAPDGSPIHYPDDDKLPLDGLVKRWKRENPGRGEPTIETKEGKKVEADDDFLAHRARRGVLQMLQRRLRDERRQLGAAIENPAGYFADMGYADDRAQPQAAGVGGLPGGASRDNAVGGEMNRLDWMVYNRPAGPGAGAPGFERGFFIKDRSEASQSDAGGGTGLTAVDPNAGGRSVATWRLAKLLGAEDQFARIEFATHTSTTGHAPGASQAELGVWSERVDGGEAADQDWTFSSTNKGQGEVSLEDPVLQQQLNIIQIVDYVARQVDRHWHNFYVDTDDAGNVRSVTGIDFDQSFGANVHKDEKGEGGVIQPTDKFVGLPDFIDEAFATRLDRVTDQMIFDALDGLISDVEVAATVVRFGHLRARIDDLRGGRAAPGQALVQNWDAGTAAAQQGERGKRYGKETYSSYIGIIRSAAVDEKMTKRHAALYEDVKGQLGPLATKGDWIDANIASVITSRIGPAGLTLQQASDLVPLVCRAVVVQLQVGEADSIATINSGLRRASEYREETDRQRAQLRGTHEFGSAAYEAAKLQIDQMVADRQAGLLRLEAEPSRLLDELDTRMKQLVQRLIVQFTTVGESERPLREAQMGGAGASDLW